MDGRIFRLLGPVPHSSVIGKVTLDPATPPPLRGSRILLSLDTQSTPHGFAGYISHCGGPPPWLQAASDLRFQIGEGDVVRLNSGVAEILFKRGSQHNTLLLTERCNCACVMCVQPPRSADDPALLGDLRRAIPLFDRDAEVVGLSGGEPTLLRGDLVDLLRILSAYLPWTQFQLLSNARLFSYLRLASDAAIAARGRLSVGVPLNGDTPNRHDHVVRRHGAFDETIRGMLNLHRCGVPVEVRVVLTRQTLPRLPGIARFVRSNLPFVSHVALMGMEVVGYAATHADALWVDPVDMADNLSEAVYYLDTFGLGVSLYNLQLCVLPEPLRRFARRSISDWKVDYPELCRPCAQRAACCGFFGTDGMRASRAIAPLSG